jgi:hypothetical protein
VLAGEGLLLGSGHLATMACWREVGRSKIVWDTSGTLGWYGAMEAVARRAIAALNPLAGDAWDRGMLFEPGRHYGRGTG